MATTNPPTGDTKSRICDRCGYRFYAHQAHLCKPETMKPLQPQSEIRKILDKFYHADPTIFPPELVARYEVQLDQAEALIEAECRQFAASELRAAAGNDMTDQMHPKDYKTDVRPTGREKGPMKEFTNEYLQCSMAAGTHGKIASVAWNNARNDFRRTLRDRADKLEKKS